MSIISTAVMLFLTALLAATILPFSSELILITSLKTTEGYFWLLIFMASLGNILGAVVNWALGRWCMSYQHHRWFPLSPDKITSYEHFFKKRGWPCLLLSWVPIIGDPLTLVAGLMHFPFLKFLFLVSIAKSIRYLIIGLSLDISL